jgi:GINS complex subunit 4
MDWGRDYELLKSSGLKLDEAGPSFHRRNEPEEDDPFSDPMIADVQENRRERRVDVVFPEEEESQGTPLEQLTRHWMNERHAPDILIAQEDLLTNLLDHLRRQVRLNVLLMFSNSFNNIVCHGQSEAVQLLRGDPSTSEEEHMRIMLVQTEIERVKFIVRSYVRTRLFKVR